MDDYDIVLIEKYPCDSKDELHGRERCYPQILPRVNKNKSDKARYFKSIKHETWLLEHSTAEI